MSDSSSENRPAAFPSAPDSHSLLDTETRLRLIEENVTDYAIFTLGVENRIISWNVGAERIVGYSEEEAIGQPGSLLFTPEDRQAGVPEREIRQAIQTGRAEDERWHLRKDGSRFWASGILTALRDESGQLYGFAKILRDFTQRHHAERIVRQQNALLNLAHDAILVCDLDNRVTFWNAGAERLYGWSAGEMVGQVARERLHTRFPSTFEAVLEALFATGQWEGELTYTRRDGTQVVVSSRWALQRDEQGDPGSILEINRDITERKQQEHQILQLNKRLQRAMTETYHRAKNSLHQVAALIDIRLLDQSETVSAEDLRHIASYIRALAALHDLLSRESQEYAQAESVSSRAWMEQMVALLEQTTGERRIRYEVQPVRLSARQASALALILNELVSNALKHSNQGDIEVSFAVQAGTGVLRVCDAGPGFPTEFQADEQANVGLGLVEALARGDLGGQTLYANREDGTGACVTITFPLPSAQAENA